MADSNPANFANLPKEKVQEIASMGGKASHGPPDTNNKRQDSANSGKENNEDPGRRADGKFLPGSEAAKEAGHIGGLHAQGKKTDEEVKEDSHNGRREDGTFLPNSEAAKDAGHKGGLAAAASHE